jgi:hypothetical protein
MNLADPTCPDDGAKLNYAFSTAPEDATKMLRQCPTCGKTFEVRMGAVAIGDMTQPAPIIAGLGSTSLQIGTAEAELERQRNLLAAIERKIKQLDEQPPPQKDSTSDKAIAELRAELDAVKAGQPAIDSKLDEAKAALAESLPDATQLAYLKIAKADATEIRTLVTRHIEEDHRRKTLESALEANRLAKIAITASVLATIAAAIGLTR